MEKILVLKKWNRSILQLSSNLLVRQMQIMLDVWRRI